MRDIPYSEAMVPLAEAMDGAGAFLSVQHNTMTVSWGTIGRIWGLPILVVLVRASRHTHALIEDEGRFTLSIPKPSAMRAQLAFAGSQSGRDYDKFAGHGIVRQDARAIDSAVVGDSAVVIECVTKYHQDMDPAALDAAIQARCYSDHDYHTLYYGEIVACYEP